VKTAQGNQDSNDIGDFYYAPPTGFLALCSANLPSVDVIPSEHFNTVTYAGTGIARDITNVGFQSDLVWLKSRNAALDHRLHDSVRGATLSLKSNGADAEADTSTFIVTDFITDGFSVGTGGGANASGNTYVAWNWKAGGTAVSNTDGTITSSVSANVDAGFSIVSYTGSGANATVGHGLSVSPEMIIVKNLTNYNWFVYHKSNTAAPETDFLNLDQTDATQDLNTIWNDTLPTASVFSVGTHIVVNANTNGFISYAFHSVDGYSKVGSFVGNGSETAGPFVHCGFKPKFVLVKRATAVGSWFMFDTDRSPYNVMNAKLSAENSGAEDSDTSWNIDFLSNGFKLRSPHVYMNSGSNTHVFLAFAETPFKYSNAR
jgi:hypothetical protein